MSDTQTSRPQIPQLPQLRIIGSFHSHSGYSKFTRAALRCALLAGYEVQAVESDLRVMVDGYGDGRRVVTHCLPEPSVLLPEQQERELAAALATEVAPDAPTLVIHLPHALNSWPQHTSGPVIGWTMSESDNMEEMWRHGARNVDLLLAPSLYCLDTFRKAVPEVPSDLMHLPVDERLWADDGYKPAEPNRPKCLFLAILRPSERKNWRVLMQAFAEEFAEEPEDVGLLIKAPNLQGIVDMAGWCRQMGAWVNVDTSISTDYMLASLYRSCDIYVQPSCEGFGLPYVEAGLCGKPSISLNMGGGRDVVTPTTGYLVPSRMEPLIGHNPYVYPRSHKFAVCNIDDLRGTLRRAYENEKKGPGRGEAAKRRMEQKFTCAALAPMLRTNIEQAKRLRRLSVEAFEIPEHPRWATVAGNWGDVMVSLGQVRAVMAATGVASIGLVYYGRDRRIVEWLEIQPWVREVVSILETDNRAMTPTFMRMCGTRRIHAPQVWSELLEAAGRDDIGKEPIAFTHLDLATNEPSRYWSGAVLSMEARAWADVEAKAVGGTFLLLNPLSLASNPKANHWSRWNEAVEWTLDHSRVKVVLVGEKRWEPPWPPHPNLIDLTGKSPTMQHVLALAERSAGVISTANNLGIFAPIAGIPTVICLTTTCGPETVYYRWMREGGVTLVENGDAMTQFKEAIEARFGEYFGESICLPLEAGREEMAAI